MAASLPYELLEMILDAYRNDITTLHSCVLINKNWCGVAIQYLWARPFRLLYSSLSRMDKNRVDNLMTTYIKGFTDVDDIKEEYFDPKRKYNKQFPLDYNSYLKEIDLWR